MRTTVDLPPGVHRRAQEMARRQHRSLSAVIADLALRGLAQIDTPVTLTTDERSGLQVLSIGRKVTSHDVAELVDEE